MLAKIFNKLLSDLCCSFRRPYFGFISGHSYLSTNDLKELRKLVGCNDELKVIEFEHAFAKLVGDGEAFSYAAARMGFYDLLKLLNVSSGDEIILPGATCAVMVNAVLKIGATPVYADIDPKTFGSSLAGISACISQNTRMIVAQHSFGIPCDIKPIVQLAKAKNIFLLEDCALALSSKLEGIKVGNFGDAALFSLDHSKPINTITGGIIYARDPALCDSLRNAKIHHESLPHSRQAALWQRFMVERFFCNSRQYGMIGLANLTLSIFRRLFRCSGDFLLDEFSSNTNSSYPYPAKLPLFLAIIGMHEIKRWDITAINRIHLMTQIIDEFKSTPLLEKLPAAYKNCHLEIVPLRFVWADPNGPLVRTSLKNFIQVNWTWFLTPIISTSEPLANFNYHDYSCPISERIGPQMVNIPCNLSLNDSVKLIKSIRKWINTRQFKELN